MSRYSPAEAAAEARMEVERRRVVTSRVSRWLPLPALIAVSPVLWSSAFGAYLPRPLILSLALLALLPFLAMASLLVWRYQAGCRLVDALRAQRLERLQDEIPDSLSKPKMLQP